MNEYLRQKVFKYCTDRMKRNTNTNIYDVWTELETDWWNFAAVLYGQWLKETSTFETKELSEQEW